MKQILSITLIVFAFNFSLGQEVYLNVGRNFTTYDYTNTLGGENPNIESSSGNFYEVGYIFPIDYKFKFSTSLTLDQFNATGGNLVNNYSWETDYIGLQGIVRYNLLEFRQGRYNFSPFSVIIKAGMNFNHIIDGIQKINGQTFKLSNENEFKGVFIKPVVGLDLQFLFSNNIAINLGYNLSKNLSFSSKERLNFNNQQLQFGVLMSFN
jgi:hypothetical protein